jgi:hypothetical protein
MSKKLDGKKQLEEMLNQPLPVSDTPRTDAETWRDEMDHVDTDYTFAQSVTVFADFARQLERELADAKEKMLNNPFCAACKEPDCCVSGDGTCAMIRKYLTADETIKQRDALAEALASLLSGVKDGWFSEGKWWHTGIEQAEQALAATKGDSHE